MDTMNRKSDISNISEDLFSLLQSFGTSRYIKKSTFIFREGEKATELFLIKSCIFQISKLSLEGKELTMRMICIRMAGSGN